MHLELCANYQVLLVRTCIPSHRPLPDSGPKAQWRIKALPLSVAKVNRRKWFVRASVKSNQCHSSACSSYILSIMGGLGAYLLILLHDDAKQRRCAEPTARRSSSRRSSWIHPRPTRSASRSSAPPSATPTSLSGVPRYLHVRASRRNLRNQKNIFSSN